MATFAHVLSVAIILFVVYVFYINYDLYHNISYRVLTTSVVNNYNYACERFGSQPFYVVVKSRNLINNATVVGDLIMGTIGRVPVITAMSLFGINDVQYMQYTSVYPISDKNGLLIENCGFIDYVDFTMYNYILILISIIILLVVGIIYMGFNRICLCFTYFRSVHNYDELN